MTLYDKMFYAIKEEKTGIDGTHDMMEAAEACERLAINDKIELLKDLIDSFCGMAAGDIKDITLERLKELESKLKQDERE